MMMMIVMRSRMIKEVMNTRMMKRTNLSRTFPAEVLNVSTTAALLSTTGKLLHTIQDRPERKIFSLSPTFTFQKVHTVQDWPDKIFLSKKAWIENSFRSLPTKIKGGPVITCSRCSDKVVLPSPSPPRQEPGSTRPGKIF